MWDFEKTTRHLEGIRKRIEAGKPPFDMTDEEIARSDEFWTRLAARNGTHFDPMEHRQPWEAPPDWEHLQRVRDEELRSRPPEKPETPSS
jgi:hypothetical protein